MHLKLHRGRWLSKRMHGDVCNRTVEASQQALTVTPSDQTILHRYTGSCHTYLHMSKHVCLQVCNLVAQMLLAGDLQAKLLCCFDMSSCTGSCWSDTSRVSCPCSCRCQLTAPHQQAAARRHQATADHLFQASLYWRQGLVRSNSLLAGVPVSTVA